MVVLLASTTLTVNADEGVLAEFREWAAKVYGGGKGHLGKALNEAIKLWMQAHKRKSAQEELFRILDEGIGAGGLKYKHRSELYDRI